MEIKMEGTVPELQAQLLELVDLIETLNEQIARTRRSNVICRTVIRSLRTQLNIAHMNDELMKELCAPDLRIELEEDVDSQDGLSETAPSQT